MQLRLEGKTQMDTNTAHLTLVKCVYMDFICLRTGIDRIPFLLFDMVYPFVQLVFVRKLLCSVFV